MTAGPVGVQEQDVAANDTDSGAVRKLKEKLAEQATFYEASAKAMQDFMSLSLDQRNKWQEAANREIEGLREELRHARNLLEHQKPSVSHTVNHVASHSCIVAFSFQHDVVDEMFMNVFPKHMANREGLIAGIEEDLKKTLDQNCSTVQERTADQRKKEVEKVKAEAEEKARAMHAITKRREEALCSRISQLLRELRVRIRISLMWRVLPVMSRSIFRKKRRRRAMCVP